MIFFMQRNSVFYLELVPCCELEYENSANNYSIGGTELLG
jgi:hypothetical protein